MTDNSDYNKPRTNLFELLPEVFRSDVNKSGIENVFNRYLTKPELKYVDGYIGQGNPSAVINRQLSEPTPNRQAFQLQPILYSQIGDVDHMATYVDILNELTRLGVDTDRNQKWGNAQVFNWIPPVDIDKIIHYRDYYWLDPDQLNSSPQYLTIKNLCANAEARVQAYQLTLDNYGEDHAIQLIDQVDDTFSIYGDLSDVFTSGYVFYIYDSINASINEKYWTAVSSVYDSGTNLTTISVSQDITDESIVSGIISLREGLSVYETARDCSCGGTVGWDRAQWDDNQVGSIIWNDALMTQITSATAPMSPIDYDLWYDTTNDELKQYLGTSWTIIRGAFSAILSATEGRHLWDLSRGCSIPTNQWVEQNKWVHKSYVPNFTVAKQAEIPIIEYDPYVELNEWTMIEHDWKYRVSQFDTFESTTAKPTTLDLAYIQITFAATKQFVVDSTHGDLTDIMPAGDKFIVTSSSDINGTYTVVESLFEDDGAGIYRTVINVVETIPVTAGSPNADYGQFQPLYTSQGDDWLSLHEHWLYIGVSDASASNHQPENPFQDIDVLATPVLEIPGGSPSYGRYRTVNNYYTQQWAVELGTLSNFALLPSLQNISLAGTDDIRVYVDDVRQYGNYLENVFRWEIVDVTIGAGGLFVVEGDQSTWVSDGDTIEIISSTGNNGVYTIDTVGISYNDATNRTTFTILETVTDLTVDGRVQYTVVSNTVKCISFDVALPQLSNIRIELGAAAAQDIGREIIAVRMVEDNTLFATQGTTAVSLIRYHKSEQVKTITNQYPYFNMFEVDGTGTNKATPLFAFRESADYPINLSIGKRIVEIEAQKNYEFEQFLIERDNDKMYAYRDISRLELIDETDVKYWIDTTTNEVLIWDGKTWSDKILTDGYYVKPIVSETTPTAPWTTIDGMLWYNSKTKVLTAYNETNMTWDVLTAYMQEVDETMQTIWKSGLNNEDYVPSYVDGTREDVAIGSTAGDWETPDQLYYNYSHENKKYLTSVELLTHFNTVIESQVDLPGFFGNKRQNFHLLDAVNYGLGGTIKEHNDSYDTFLSSVYVNNVTPLGLIEFAQNQYDNSLSTLTELFRKDAAAYLTDTSEASLLNIGSAVADTIITQYELNDNASLIYGDSTTYNATTGDGIKNWIATLPFLKLAFAKRPELHIDNDRNIVEVSHHDGHRSQISVESSTIERINRQVIATDDPRTLAIDTIGLASVNTPPTLMNDLTSAFGTTTPLTGWYWYHAPAAGGNKLYRFNVISVSSVQPSITTPDDALWYDSGTNTLKIKAGTSWNVVTTLGDSIITSAWKEININEIVGEIIFEAETRLYNAVPAFDELVFDFNSLIADGADQTAYDTYYEESFAGYIAERQIASPYSSEGIYKITDPFTWNYKNSLYNTGTSYPSPSNLIGSPATGPTGGTWQDLYEKIYGTPYPHLEPWKLQGYDERPSWWNDEYKDTTGTRRWLYTHATTTGMWENIRKGWIPAGEILPNGETAIGGITEVASYSFFSVNVDDNILDGTYGLDSLLPPYWDHKPTYGNVYTGVVRSVFNNLQAEIINPNFDYSNDDKGLEEWKWSVSSQYVYDTLAVAFRMQPVRFIHFAFGTEYHIVDDLQIDKRTGKVYSHSDAIFHGDVVDGSTAASIDGINQWYTNHSRYSGYDISFSDFRRQWVNWVAPLGYQFGSFVETDSAYIDNKNFDVNKKDYSILMKRSPGITDIWVDSFDVKLTYMPPSRVSYDPGREWRFEVTTPSPTGRSLSYYDVHNYEFSFKTGTNVGTLYQYAIVDTNAVYDTITIAGNRTDIFTEDGQITITGSTGNDGTYTINSVLYDLANDETTIGTVENLPDPTNDGLVVLTYRLLPWATGDEVYLSSTRNLPLEFDDSIKYYIIKDSSISFRIAETYDEATAGIGIDIATIGTGFQYVGQLKSTFNALSGEKVWRHYELDTTRIQTFIPPHPVEGTQEVIDLVDGYVAYVETQGVTFNNASNLEIDEITGRAVNWQLEIERFIDWTTAQRAIKYQEPDYYPVTLDATTDMVTFTEQLPVWGTGTKVTLSVFDGVLPVPLIRNIPYYIIRPTETEFKLALTSYDAENGTAVDITGVGTGDVLIQEHVDRQVFPTHEINPFRNNLWIEHDQGIISNIESGPYKDIRAEQTVYDQYGRSLDISEISILREDKISRLHMKPEVANDKNNSFVTTDDAYSYIHIGGAHVFLDGYEHVTLFNNYSIEGFLIYDPFLGLNSSKFDVRLNRQIEFTLRPNVGGFVLKDDQLVRNIESSVIDMQNYYDTYNLSETTDVALHSRKLLGYDRSNTYLDEININPKSNFVFWRGMIQNKGSVNSVNAFINSRRFIDAKVDEYWAYKLAEFGDAREKEYISLNLFTEDSLSTELKIEFTATALEVPATGFVGIDLTNSERWYEQPLQNEKLVDNTEMYFDAEITTVDDAPIIKVI